MPQLSMIGLASARRRMASEEREYQDIYNFLQHHQYPPGYDKSQKRNFRRKATTNYKVDKGLLYFCKKGSKEWRQVARSSRDKERILIACHSLSEGNYKVLLAGQIVKHQVTVHIIDCVAE